MPVAQVGDDTTATAAQYNALVSAVQSETTGHAHTGDANAGKRISHADVTDGVIKDLSESNTHAEIDAHLAAGTEIHGLPANVKPQGVALATPYTFQYGDAGGAGTVVTTLSTILGVVVTPGWAGNQAAPWAGVTNIVNAAGASSFDIYITWKDQNTPTINGAYWIAWGIL